MGLIERVISVDQELSGNGRWLKGTVNSSLVVDVEKQIFFWNSKGISGDVYVWLREVKGLSYTESKEYLKTFPEFSGTFIHEVNNTEEIVVYPKLVDVFYEEGRNASTAYWDKRGINESTIHRFKLGFHNNFYTIPIYQDGVFKNFQLRRDVPTKEIRYYYSNTGRLLFNSDLLKVTNSIIITEGPTDCLRLMQEGIMAVSHTAGAEGWNSAWFKYFMHQKDIFVVYDNDSAGRLGAKKVAKNLGEYKTKIYNFDGYDDKFDIVDFFNSGGTKDEFMSMVLGLSNYAFLIGGCDEGSIAQKT
jgi:DNA primase